VRVGVYLVVQAFEIAHQPEIEGIGQQSKQAAQGQERRASGGLVHGVGDKGGDGDARDKVDDTFHQQRLEIRY
jgi:hypothetical protein